MAVKAAVYLVGSTRSGTSALRNAICETRYSGAGEGHFIGILLRLHNAITTHYRLHAAALSEGTMLAKVPQREMHMNVNNLYRQISAKYLPGDYVLDKTPNAEPLLAIQYIEQLWPVVRFIFCRRRGIDNVLSKQRKWPKKSFESHCREWVQMLDLWEAHSKNLKSPWLEIEFFNLENSMAEIAHRLGDFLELEEDEVARMLQYLKTNRPQGLSNPQSYCSLAETGWSEDQIQMFIEICGRTMEKYNYGLVDYWN